MWHLGEGIHGLIRVERGHGSAERSFIVVAWWEVRLHVWVRVVRGSEQVHGGISGERGHTRCRREDERLKWGGCESVQLGGAV